MSNKRKHSDDDDGGGQGEKKRKVKSDSDATDSDGEQQERLRQDDLLAPDPGVVDIEEKDDSSRTDPMIVTASPRCNNDAKKYHLTTEDAYCAAGRWIRLFWECRLPLGLKLDSKSNVRSTQEIILKWIVSSGWSLLTLLSRTQDAQVWKFFSSNMWDKYQARDQKSPFLNGVGYLHLAIFGQLGTEGKKWFERQGITGPVLFALLSDPGTNYKQWIEQCEKSLNGDNVINIAAAVFALTRMGIRGNRNLREVKQQSIQAAVKKLAVHVDKYDQFKNREIEHYHAALALLILRRYAPDATKDQQLPWGKVHAMVVSIARVGLQLDARPLDSEGGLKQISMVCDTLLQEPSSGDGKRLSDDSTAKYRLLSIAASIACFVAFVNLERPPANFNHEILARDNKAISNVGNLIRVVDDFQNAQEQNLEYVEQMDALGLDGDANEPLEMDPDCKLDQTAEIIVISDSSNSAEKPVAGEGKEEKVDNDDAGMDTSQDKENSASRDRDFPPNSNSNSGGGGVIDEREPPKFEWADQAEPVTVQVLVDDGSPDLGSLGLPMTDMDEMQLPDNPLFASHNGPPPLELDQDSFKTSHGQRSDDDDNNDDVSATETKEMEEEDDDDVIIVEKAQRAEERGGGKEEKQQRQEAPMQMETRNSNAAQPAEPTESYQRENKAILDTKWEGDQLIKVEMKFPLTIRLNKDKLANVVLDDVDIARDGSNGGKTPVDYVMNEDGLKAAMSDAIEVHTASPVGKHVVICQFPNEWYGSGAKETADLAVRCITHKILLRALREKKANTMTSTEFLSWMRNKDWSGTNLAVDDANDEMFVYCVEKASGLIPEGQPAHLSRSILSNDSKEPGCLHGSHGLIGIFLICDGDAKHAEKNQNVTTSHLKSNLMAIKAPRDDFTGPLRLSVITKGMM